MRISIIIPTLCGIALMVSGGEEGARKKKTIFEKEQYEYDFKVEKGEYIFIGGMNGAEGIVSPFSVEHATYRVVKEDIRDERLRVEIHPPGRHKLAKKDMWSIKCGGADYEAYYGGVEYLKPIPGEIKLQCKGLRLPFTVEGLRVYLFPFRIVNKQVHSVVLAITDDKEKLKNNLNINTKTEIYGNFWKAVCRKPLFMDWDKYEDGDADTPSSK